MLPVLHPLQKTKIELKRGITRVDLFAKLNNDESARKVSVLLKQAHDLIEEIERETV
jgi:hypothetical protein